MTVSLSRPDPSVADLGTDLELTHPQVPAGAVIPCGYCQAAIPAGSFLYTTSSGRMLAASCPGCWTRILLPKGTWQRWSSSPRAM